MCRWFVLCLRVVMFVSSGVGFCFGADRVASDVSPPGEYIGLRSARGNCRWLSVRLGLARRQMIDRKLEVEFRPVRGSLYLREVEMVYEYMLI